MKNYLFFLIILFFSFVNLNLYGKKIPELKFTPNSIYIYGIESKDNYVVSYGDLGTIYYSLDYGSNWDRKQLFDYGVFNSCFFHNDEIILFHELGGIVILDINFNIVKKINLFNEKIISVLKSADGYLIRSLNSLILLNYNLEILKRIDLNSNHYIKFIDNEFANLLKFQDLNKIQEYKTNSMTIFNGLYYLYTDSNIISRFDANLKYIDEFKVWDTLCIDCNLWNQLHVKDNFMYLNQYNKFVKTSNFNDFKNLDLNEKILKIKSINNKLIVITAKNFNNKIFELDSNNFLIEIANYKKEEFITYNVHQEITDFTLSGNYIIILYSNGNQVYRIKTDKENEQFTETKRDNRPIYTTPENSFFNLTNIDNFSGGNKLIYDKNSNLYILPYSIYTNKINIENKINNQYSFQSLRNLNYIYNSNDSLKNCLPVFKKVNYPDINKLFYLDLVQNINYTNKNITKLVYDNLFNYSIFRIDDNFKDVKIYNLNLSLNSNNNTFSNLFVKENICFVENNSVISNQFPQFAKILHFDSNYSKFNEVKRENKYIDYIYSKKRDYYLFYEFDYRDSIKHILHTKDNFNTIDTIFSFTKNDKIIYQDYYEFTHNDIDFVAFFNYRHVFFSPNNQFVVGEMYILNTQTNEFNLRFTFPDEINTFYDFEKRNHALTSYDNDTLYISAYGSLYSYLLERPNRAPQQIVKFPNNGRFRFNFQKIGSRFYGLYSDTLRIHNNYWLDISFKEVEDPKPIIQANDFDFGTFDIKETEYKKVKIKVENLSKEADLMIIDYYISDTLNFKSNIKNKFPNLPYYLNKGDSIEIDFEFVPKNIGLKESKVEFISNALTQDSFIELKGEAIDTIKTSVENIEEVTYIYTTPPYPNPTRSEVTAKFYWDSRIDIDNSEIAVFDINGNKVSGKENLSLEKLNEWSGNIKWNCVGVPSGTYLIKIQHGNNTKSVKVVVN